jgi:hypothetical protein
MGRGTLRYDKFVVITAELTPEQETRLTCFSFSKGRMPETFDLGFFHPSQITSYFCKKCDRSYDSESPKPMVSVSLAGEEEHTSLVYVCGHCNGTVYIGYLPSARGVPEEFIERDETGDYKRPTQDSVNSLLAKLNEQAEMGRGDALNKPHYHHELDIAVRWARKIAYDISKNLRELEETFRRGYVARLERELPALVSEIKDKSHGFSLVGIDSGGITPYEGEGLDWRMDQLFQTLELTKPSDPEINKDVYRILELYWKMSYDEREKLAVQKADLEKRIAEESDILNNVRRKQGEFVAKVGMTNAQVDEARNNPLDTWPLKDD